NENPGLGGKEMAAALNMSLSRLARVFKMLMGISLVEYRNRLRLERFEAVIDRGPKNLLDAGQDAPHGLLPVDERNPVIIYNDSSSDNWMGEYSVLLANSGGPALAGIVITASSYWPAVADNVTGWTNLVSAAESGGLTNLPAVTTSAGKPLVRPADGQIGHTTANDSAGAELILSLSRKLGVPARPVVILAGTQLTDIADAYLVDPTVVDRVVVVAAL